MPGRRGAGSRRTPDGARGGSVLPDDRNRDDDLFGPVVCRDDAAWRGTATVNDGGAVAWSRSEGFVQAVHRPALEVFDRVGGDDSFASGLLYGLLEGESLQLAVDYEAAHGALAMTTPGDTSMSARAGVQRLAGAVHGGGSEQQSVVLQHLPTFEQLLQFEARQAELVIGLVRVEPGQLGTGQRVEQLLGARTVASQVDVEVVAVADPPPDVGHLAGRKRGPQHGRPERVRAAAGLNCGEQVRVRDDGIVSARPACDRDGQVLPLRELFRSTATASITATPWSCSSPASTACPIAASRSISAVVPPRRAPTHLHGAESPWSRGR